MRKVFPKSAFVTVPLRTKVTKGADRALPGLQQPTSWSTPHKPAGGP
jgi:hypothetical protein